MKTRQDNYTTDCTNMVDVEMKLNCHNRSNRVWSMTKTRQDKYMIDRTGVVYLENDTELS